MNSYRRSDLANVSEITRTLAADLERDATNAPADASELARIAAEYRRLVGLERRVAGVVDELRARADVVESDGYIGSFAEGAGYRTAADLLTRALAGGDGDTTTSATGDHAEDKP